MMDYLLIYSTRVRTLYLSGTMTASSLSTMNYLLSARLPGWSGPCRRFGSRGQATRINQLIAGRPTAPRPLPPRAESGCS
jgi:hypothetical protein